MAETVKATWQRLDSALRPGPVLRAVIRSTSPLLPLKSSRKYRTRRQDSWEKQRELSSSPSLLRPLQSSSAPLLPKPKVVLPPLSGLGLDAIERLYQAKCEDLHIPVLPDQFLRFYEFCNRSARDRRLNLEDCNFGPGTALTISSILHSTSEFVYLHLGKNPLGAQGAATVLQTLSKACHWVHLGLNNCDLGPDFVPSLSLYLESHPSLTSIDLSSQEGLYRNRLGAQTGFAFQSILHQNPVLTVLNLSGVVLGPDGLEALAGGITGNTSLIWLDISATGLTGVSCKSLGQAICASKVKYLSVQSNKLGGDGVEYIGKMTSGEWGVCPLHTLNAAKCDITALSSVKLLPGLLKSAFLEKLYLDDNKLSGEYSMELYSLLAENGMLRELGMNNCGLKEDGIIAVAEGLARNRSLIKLDLAGNSCEDKGAIALAAALQDNSHLISLDLSCNRIRETGGAALCRGLQFNKTLESLKLRDNGIGENSAKILAQIAKRNKSLTHVGLEFNPVSTRLKQEICRNASTNKIRKQRSVTPLLRSSIKNLKVSKTAFSDIDVEIEKRKAEKVILEANLEAQNQRLARIPVEENIKFEEIRTQLETAKKTKLDKALELKELQTQLKEEKTHGEETYKQLESDFFELAATTKRLEKELQRTKETYNLKRLQATQQLTQAQANYKKELSFKQLAEYSLSSLQQEIAGEIALNYTHKSRKGRKK